MLQVRERQQEISLLQAVGWQAALVQHTVRSTLPLLLVALTVVLLLVGVSMLATLPAVCAMSRVEAVEVLRME